MTQKIAVLIPCFNEEATVADVIKDFQQHLPDADIYVYNNCSTDNTASIAKACGATVVDAPIKGKGNTVKQMFHEVEADIYLMTDGDSTYMAKDAQTLIDTLNQGYDMVIGDRLASTYFTENKNPLRELGNKMVPFLVNTLFKGHITDIMTGYRAFSRDFVKNMNVKAHYFEIETEMAIYALTHGYKVTAIVIDYKDRPDGSKSKLHAIKDGTKVMWFIVKEYFSYAKSRCKTKKHQSPD